VVCEVDPAGAGGGEAVRMWRQIVQGLIAFVVVVGLAVWTFVWVHFVVKYW
jgi:hypothetical protein